MKKTLLGTVVCLGALIGTASARSNDEMKVTLPDGASFGGVDLRPGEYTIRDMSDNGNAAVLQIFASDGNSVAAMAHVVDSPKFLSKLNGMVLTPTGEGYRIQSIHFAGNDTEFEFSPK